ncbi:hypothetical protein TI39_contig342g00041 [Zymoseptoria brevis]|uniref:FCP1 homology domain-containing protein n=1 Tax=Zymoseptoria brevis TaxID=1047168 RepID=A0A0F4GSV8_9PEZI|nr:hypothetical protein TI39_contig342g00041 [Zymoseptoria brevis]
MTSYFRVCSRCSSRYTATRFRANTPVFVAAMASPINFQVLEDPRPPSQIVDNTSGAVASAVDRSRNRKPRSQRKAPSGFDTAAQSDSQSQASNTPFATHPTSGSGRAEARPAKASGNARSVMPPKDGTQAIDPGILSTETLRPAKSRRPRNKPAKSTGASQRPYSTCASSDHAKPTETTSETEGAPDDTISQAPSLQSGVMDLNILQPSSRPDRALWKPRSGPASVERDLNTSSAVLGNKNPEMKEPRRSNRIANRNKMAQLKADPSNEEMSVESRASVPTASDPAFAGSSDKTDCVADFTTSHHSDSVQKLTPSERTSPNIALHGPSDGRSQASGSDPPPFGLRQSSSLNSHPLAPDASLAMTARASPNDLAAQLNGLSLSAKSPKEPRRRREKPAKLPTVRRKHSTPRLNIMERPMVTKEYSAQANEPPHTTKNFLPLLVILDLNGTLLYRSHAGGAKFTPRPGLEEFLEYLFENHSVMVWSSARRQNVDGMCRVAFTPQQFNQLVGIWAREDLQLTPEAFKAHSQVYKQLTWVWEDEGLQRSNPLAPDRWCQANTVLVDDSNTKAVSEPFNLLEVPEFVNSREQQSEEVLRDVRRYLNQLGFQKDVSAHMRVRPFVYGKEEEVVDGGEGEGEGGCEAKEFDRENGGAVGGQEEGKEDGGDERAEQAARWRSLSNA